MKLCHFLVTLVSAISMATAAFDVKFCQDRMKPFFNKTSQGGTPPSFYDDFYTLGEMKILANKTVDIIEEYFSNEAGMMYLSIKGPGNLQQIWADANTDEEMVSPGGDEVCTDEPLEGSPFAQELGFAPPGSSGKLSMVTPDKALGWNKDFQKSVYYISESEIRGIKTYEWYVCSYNPAVDATMFGDWHLADASQLPVKSDDDDNNIVLPVMLHLQGVNNTDPANPIKFDIRYDFAMYDKILGTDPAFQPPVHMLCAAKPSAQKPLPRMPNYFKLNGEQIAIRNPDAQMSDPPSLIYTKEEFIGFMGIFIQDFVTTPNQENGVNDKSYVKNVHDFHTGLSFEMDLTTGSCLINVIDPGSTSAALPLAGGLVRMKNAQEFFDLDYNQYQYMGIHKKRGFDCDTWSAFFTGQQTQDTRKGLYTWYFASKEFLKHHEFQNASAPLPIALEVSQENQFVQFNFYEYATKDSMKVPDLTDCFEASDIKDIEIYISGRYDKVVAPNYAGFGRAFYVALMEQTRIGSPLRMANIDYQPASNSETVVRFSLLDYSTVKKKGDVSSADTFVGNDDVYNDLVKAVNDGKFILNVQTIIGKQAGSLKVRARSGSVGQIKRGKFVASGASNETTYDEGAMWGLGVGLLVFGLLVGIGAIFGIKKLRKVRGSGDIGMAKLGDE